MMIQYFWGGTIFWDCTSRSKTRLILYWFELSGSTLPVDREPVGTIADPIGSVDIVSGNRSLGGASETSEHNVTISSFQPSQRWQYLPNTSQYCIRLQKALEYLESKLADMTFYRLPSGADLSAIRTNSLIYNGEPLTRNHAFGTF